MNHQNNYIELCRTLKYWWQCCKKF